MKNKKNLYILIIFMLSNIIISKSFPLFNFKAKLQRRKMHQQIEERLNSSSNLSEDSRNMNITICRLEKELIKQAIDFINERLTLENFELVVNNPNNFINFLEKEMRENNTSEELTNTILVIIKLLAKRNFHILEKIGASNFQTKICQLENQYRISTNTEAYNPEPLEDISFYVTEELN